jgi:NAD(P)-dependent dehydrogenase (short-subunit alcohol dehydrogenase family)
MNSPVVLITGALTGIGRATGCGMSLACAGDLVLAAESARF